MELSLLKKAKKGDKKALKKLMINNSEYIYKLAFMHTKYEDDAKRILTDTMYFIEDNMSKLDENQNIILWLYKITIINTNNFLKYVGMVDKDKSLDKYYCDGKINLYEAIDLLDVKYKNVVIFKCYFDLSDEEIGEVLDLNTDTVKIYFRQSLKKIKASVGEYL